MQTFTILADSSENPHKQPWWKFWEKSPNEETIQNEHFAITIKYIKTTSLRAIEGGVEIRRLFLSDKLSQGEEEEDDNLNRSISLETFPQIVKSKGLGDSRNTSIAFYDEEIDGDYLIELAKLCKEITIVSDSFNNSLADKVLKETGLIIESKKTLQEANCDFIINNNGEISDFIDENKYEITIKYDLLPLLPVKVNNLRLIKWLLNKEIIKLAECRISYYKDLSAIPI